MEAPRRILVINVTRIGDTLFVTPVPGTGGILVGAAITVMAHPKRAEVLENLPFVAQVCSIEKRRAILRGRWPGKDYDLALVSAMMPHWSLTDCGWRPGGGRSVNATPSLMHSFFAPVDEPSPLWRTCSGPCATADRCLGRAPGGRRLSCGCVTRSGSGPNSV